MGSGSYNPTAWVGYKSATGTHTKTVEEIYTQREIAQELDPKRISLRESRDSADNPLSTPIIIGLDVTGSMGYLLDHMAKKGMEDTLAGIYDSQPVQNPHIMAMAIGDIECDRAPLQVTQFEADIRIQQQMERIYLERNGGGNDSESYTLPWYFATHYTVTDHWEKRGQKGFIFTVGDEMPNQVLRASKLAKHLGGQARTDKLSAEELLAEVSKKWNVYHLIVGEGSYARSNKPAVSGAWAELLGERAIWLNNHRKMGTVITQLLHEAAGPVSAGVVATWSSADFVRAMDLN